MARRSLYDMIRRPSLRSTTEARDGLMFFVLPPLLLALVFGICAMASHPVPPKSPAVAAAEPSPVAALPEVAPEESAPVASDAPAIDAGDDITTPGADVSAGDEDEFENDDFEEEEEPAAAADSDV